MIDYSQNQEVYDFGDVVKLSLTSYGNNSRILSGVNYAYQVIKDNEVLIHGEGNSSKEGIYNLEYELPEELSNDLHINLEARKRRQRQQFSIRIPLEQEKESCF